MSGSRFDYGVSWYTKAKCDLYFPEDDLACKWCPLMGIEMASNRRYCRKTGEILFSIDTIGSDCPLDWQTVTEDMEKED